MDLRDQFEAIDLSTIDRYVKEGQEEHLHLDFKTVGRAEMDRDDRKNLAVAISGFANSDGGLVVWGVNARLGSDGSDRARDKEAIASLSAFYSRLNEHERQATNPSAIGVMHRKVHESDDSGYAVTLVPASDSGPHMAKLGENRYYRRSGSNFLVMEHYEVADMFGRRSRPLLKCVLDIEPLQITDPDVNARMHYACALVVGLRNEGRGLAHAPYLRLKSHPYSVSEAGIDGRRGEPIRRIASSRLSEWIVFGGDANQVVHPGTTVHVAAIPVEFDSYLHAARGRDAPNDIRIDYEFASDGVPLESGAHLIAGFELVHELNEQWCARPGRN